MNLTHRPDQIPAAIARCDQRLRDIATKRAATLTDLTNLLHEDRQSGRAIMRPALHRLLAMLGMGTLSLDTNLVIDGSFVNHAPAVQAGGVVGLVSGHFVSSIWARTFATADSSADSAA